MSEDIVEMLAIVSGTVQGVGFRYTVLMHTQPLGIKGTVRNLADGTVEIRAQGSRVALDRLLSLINEEPGAGSVDSISVHFSDPGTPYTSFSILK